MYSILLSKLKLNGIQIKFPKGPQVIFPKGPQFVFSNGSQVTFPKGPQVTFPKGPQVTFPKGHKSKHRPWKIPSYLYKDEEEEEYMKQRLN